MALSGVSSLHAAELELIGAYGNTDGSVGLGGASSLVVSPDSKHLYVAAATDRGVGLFKWDASGEPSHLFQPAPGRSDIPVKVLLSANGSNLYVAFKSFDKGWVALYERHQGTGELTFRASYDTLGDVSDFVISNDGRNLYLSGANGVVVFERNGATGELTKIDTEVDDKDGVDGVDGIAGSAGLTLSPDGKYLFVAGMEDDAVAVFTRSTATGKLEFVEALRNDPVKGVIGLAGARAVALSPDGVNLYVAGAQDNALAVFKRNFISGELTFLEAWTQGGVNGERMVSELDLDGISAIAVSPNGSRVYASSAIQNVIAIFRTVPQSRKLEFMEVQEGSIGMVSLALSPGGAYLYAAAPVDGTGKVAVFKTANAAPVASNDIAVAAAGSPIMINVLANDTDPDNDALQLADADDSSAQGGSVVVNGDGTITYTAPAGFTGADSFRYRLSDVRNAAPVEAQVSVTVEPAGTPIPDSTGGATTSASGGGGAMDGWFGMMLMGAMALFRRKGRRSDDNADSYPLGYESATIFLNQKY